MFTASGFTFTAGIPQPKAIIEVIDFDGDGGVTTPSVTLSVNGNILHPPGSPGSYTLEESCNGTLAFVSGQTFDIVTAPNGKEIWLIQTNSGNVFQGSAKRTADEGDDKDDKDK